MIIDAVRAVPQYARLLEALPGPGEVRSLGGLAGSSPAVLAAALARDVDRTLLIVAGTAAQADDIEADLEALEYRQTRTFPQRESVHPGTDDPHVEISAQRVEALAGVLSGRAGLVVTTGRALSERFPVPASWSDLELSLELGDSLDRAELIESLERAGYEETAMVEAVGEYAVRGGIIDVFSITSIDPIRIELWGDEIVSVRTFDVLDQRSIEDRSDVRILPIRFPDGGTGENGSEPQVRSLLEVLPEPTLLLQVDPETEAEDRQRGWRELGRRTEMPERYQHSPDRLDPLLERFGRLVVEPEGSDADLDFEIRAPEAIDRKIDRLVDVARTASREGGRVLILCDNDGQAQRLEEILEEAADARTFGDITLGIGPLAEGFVVGRAQPPLWLLTDHEIFQRARRPRARALASGRGAVESLSELQPGDYVVHLDHGIGRFQGLERVRVHGQELETLVIEYAGGELLRVPHYRAELIERWIAEPDDDGSSVAPRLHRLGGKSWGRLKKRTREAIRTMAAELLELYASRRVATGHAFSPDTRWQREMESAFVYEDTPDQETVSEEIKRDMERPQPMDRLVCGDVGYGKTELAIRAAFKAVQDGKQVAVLAPTTVLVEQHTQTFSARLADYPVRIESLSRFRTAKEQAEVLDGLAVGSVDIVIGTHRLLSSDVSFKDLGLLVVDEEQRFGVTQKERLKALKRSVDVLTMTATPIPRTLHFSFSGLRDLSLIRTPPRNRRPVLTHVLTWDDRMIEDAIRLEVDRGGQVFFVHNRVESIQEIAAKVRRLVPDLRVEIAHGQMSERKLERVMTDFVRGTIDVLVATAIVENGLDVPNANTMVVHRADYFGLAQLYQLRGRVGRSHQRAFCYLVIPPNLPLETERRLQLLEQHTELGAGYRIALKDLQLRGAGNLLGTEQSGFAQAVGFDLYLRLLEETVRNMKDGAGERTRGKSPEVSISGASYIPDGFIPVDAQKLDLYRRLSKAADPEELDNLEDELRDRFGPPPDEVTRMIAAARVRILGRRLGVERVLASGDEARVNFRKGAIPRLTPLRDALADRAVEVDVRRLQPLSLMFRQLGSDDVLTLIVDALLLLNREEDQLVAAG